MILVTGAAGKTGQAIIAALVARQQPVKAFVSRPEHQQLMKQLGASAVAVGNLLNREAVREAVSGVRSIYHICPNMHPEEETIGEIVLEAACAENCSHFVYHSVLHPHVREMPHHWHKAKVEAKLFKSTFNYTILQPAAYMQNLLANRDQIVSQGIYAIPYSPQTRLGMVDLADVAEAAAVVLTEPGHFGAIYELCCEECLTQTEIGEMLQNHLGIEVRTEVLSTQQWQQQARQAKLNPYKISTLIKMFRYYERFGFCGNANTLLNLLGRKATTMLTFIAREF